MNKRAILGDLKLNWLTGSGISEPYYDHMHTCMQTQKAKRMKKLRQSTVKPVLGTLINFLSMKQANTRELQQANKRVYQKNFEVHTLNLSLFFQSCATATHVMWC